VFNRILGFMRESRAQSTLDALRTRLAVTASVRRDDAWQIIPAPDVVPGDVAKLSPGGMVAADVRVVEGNILLDQSTITGEWPPIEAGPGQDACAGTLVRRGEALAEVTATGTRTKFGRTAELVRTAHIASSQQVPVSRVVRNLAIGAFAIGFDLEQLRTPAAVTLVFSGLAVLYAVRERDHLWHSRPSGWLMACSVIDVTIVASLAGFGIVMTALPVHVVFGVLLAAAGFAFVLDIVKVGLFARLEMV